MIGLQEPQDFLFENIRWSEASVLEQTLAHLQQRGLAYKLLPRRRDLDTSEDLQRIRSDPALVSLSFKRTMNVLKNI